MRWRARLSVGGWAVVLVAGDGAELGFSSVNQFGRLRFFSKRHPSRLGDWFPDWQAVDAALAQARVVRPPVGQSGRYGYRNSSKRGELCEMIAAALNAAGVFPAEARA